MSPPSLQIAGFSACGPSQRAREAPKYSMVSFMFLVVSQANDWEEDSNSFGEREDISRN